MEENKTTEMTRMPAHNSRFAKAGVSCFYDEYAINYFQLKFNGPLNECNCVHNH